MPPLTRLYLKTALVYLIAALLAGLALATGLPFTIPGLGAVYFHLLMVGWVTQLIFGVGYWMFPKFSRERPHRSEALAWATYFLLNVGLLLRAFGEPLSAAQPGTAWGWLLVASAILQLAAGWAFIANTWPRVKER